MSRELSVCLLPEVDKAQHLVALLAFAQVGVGVAKHIGLGFLGDEGQHGLVAATSLGQVVALDELVLPEEGDGMKVELARAPERSELDRLVSLVRSSQKVQPLHKGSGLSVE
jgi:hypothetical protein